MVNVGVPTETLGQEEEGDLAEAQGLLVIRLELLGKQSRLGA